MSDRPQDRPHGVAQGATVLLLLGLLTLVGASTGSSRANETPTGEPEPTSSRLIPASHDSIERQPDDVAAIAVSPDGSRLLRSREQFDWPYKVTVELVDAADGRIVDGLDYGRCSSVEDGVWSGSMVVAHQGRVGGCSSWPQGMLVTFDLSGDGVTLADTWILEGPSGSWDWSFASTGRPSFESPQIVTVDVRFPQDIDVRYRCTTGIDACQSTTSQR